MPPPEDLSTKEVNAQSSLANYVNNISKSRYRDEEKRYKNQEPSLAKSKPWPEFLRLAISRQCLEGRSRNAKVEVYDEDEGLLLSTGKREKTLFGFDKAEDPRLARAISDLDKRARTYNEHHLSNTKSSRRHSHHERVEENAPHGHSKRGEKLLVESHHLRRRHDAGEQDGEPRRITAPPPRRSQMPLNYDYGSDRAPLHGRRNDPAPPQEYVYPAGPPIVITMPSQYSEPRRQDYQPPPQRPAQTRSHLSSADAPSMSGGRRPPAPMAPSLSELDPHRADRLPERRESASQSGHGYSNRPPDRHSQGGGSVHESRRDDCSQGGGSVSGSLRDGNSRVESWAFGSSDGARPAGRQGRRQFEVGRQSIHSGSNADSDESWDSKATVGVPNWGTGVGESRVSNRREARVSDRHTSRALDGHDGRSERGP